MKEVFDGVIVGSFMAFLQAGVLLAPLGLGWGMIYHPKVTLGGLALYGVSYFDGAQVSPKKNRTWPAFSSGFWLLKFMRSYFPQKVHLPKAFPAAVENAEEKKLQYILAVHPHGTMSEFRVMLDAQLTALLPALQGKIRWLAASVLFRLPLIREICLWTSCIDASRKVTEDFLKAGFTIGVVPGGEQEQLRTQYGKEAVYLKSRKGFVKLAIRFGVPLVPCYVFGCVDLYKTSGFLFGVRRALVSKLGVCLPFCWGPKGLPLTPFRRPLDVVVGEPLSVGSNPSPTDEEVAEALSKYTAALVALFDANKDKFGCGERMLDVM